MMRFLFILLLAPGSSLLAQTEPTPRQSFPNHPLPVSKEPVLKKADTISPQQKVMLQRVYAEQWLLQGRPAYKTNEGTIYHMPIDSMRCLVPKAGSNSPMPTAKPTIKQAPMPNGFPSKPKQRLRTEP